MHFAYKEGDEDLIKLIIDKGGMQNIKNSEGLKPSEFYNCKWLMNIFIDYFNFLK